MFNAAVTELKLNVAECLDDMPSEKEVFESVINKLNQCVSTDELNSFYQWLTGRFDELFSNGHRDQAIATDISLSIIEMYAL